MTPRISSSCGPSGPTRRLSCPMASTAWPASIVSGALLAAVVAVALSPLSPLGPVRAVYPGAAVAADWTVLGIGVLAVVVVLGAAAAIMAWRGVPHRAAQRAGPPSTSRAAQAVATTGLPVPTLVGVRFALERGRGRTAVPVRSTLLGAVLAVALVVSTLTFGSGLQSLVSRPALYGWNFTYLLNASNTTPPKALTLLDHDPDVAAWDGYDYNIAEVDGQNLPFLFEYGHSSDQASHQSTDPERPRRRREPTDRSGHGHPGPAAQAPRRYRPGLLRLSPERSPVHPPTALRGGGDGDHAGRRVLQCHRRPHLDGDGGADRGDRSAQGIPGGVAELDRRAGRAQPGLRATAPGRGPGGRVGRHAAGGPCRRPDHRRRARGRRVRQQRHRARCPTAGRDRQLRDHRGDPGADGHGVGRRRHRGPRPHPHRLGPAETPRPGPAQVARVHPAPAGRGAVLAGLGLLGHRHRHRGAPGHRRGPHAVDPVRPRDLRRPRAHRPGALGGPGGRGHRWCWPIWWPPCPDAWRRGHPRPCCCGRSDAGEAPVSNTCSLQCHSWLSPCRGPSTISGHPSTR